jgi:hypothetical protein
MANSALVGGTNVNIKDDNVANATGAPAPPVMSIKDDPNDLPLSSTGRTGTVNFRPYTDLCRPAAVSCPPKKRFRRGGDESHLAASLETTVDHLYPELLCLLFAYLDVKSRGRAAQVCN